jgi:hypothetical protein
MGSDVYADDKDIFLFMPGYLTSVVVPKQLRIAISTVGSGCERSQKLNK